MESCRWCGGGMIPSPDGGHGIVCEGCWWPSAECRCPIRPALVTKHTPRQYVEFRACGHMWTGVASEDPAGHDHACGRAFEHNGHHACPACPATIANPASYIGP